MIREVHGLLAGMGRGTYTDDTEMMIGIMESLVESPQSDPALASFLLTHSFRKSVVVAVLWQFNCGGDTDTTGAMAGAIAGAYYGCGQVPNDWLDLLENGLKGRSYVLSFAEKLAEIKGKQTSRNAKS